jgi:hypothetical protein
VSLPIVARQRVDKYSLIVARQRLGKKTPIVARQQLGRNVTAVTNTHATIGELLYSSISMWPVSYQEKKAINSSQNSLLFFQNKESKLKMDVREMGWSTDPIHLAQDRDHFRAIVNTVMNLRAP